MIKHILASVGEQPPLQNGPSVPEAGRGTHLGQVSLELMGHRPVSADEIVRRWRERSPEVPEAEQLVFTWDSISMGAPIDIELRSDRIEDLVAVGEQLKAALGGYPGVSDVRDSFHAGKREIKLAVLPAAEALGIDLEDVVGFAHFVRIDVRRDEIPIEASASDKAVRQGISVWIEGCRVVHPILVQARVFPGGVEQLGA